MVKPGETHKYREDYGGGLDWFWGFEPNDCGFYRVTLNKADKTVTFAPRNSSALATDPASRPDCLDTYFIGDTLYVESGEKDVEVYDMNGRCLGRSDSGRIAIDGLSAGAYVVKSACKVVKILKK